MKEEFLQFLWKHGLFIKEGLTTTDGKPVEIINPGIWNSDSGPDFFNAKIIIDGITWAGNVEIHQKSSSWKTHNHDKNQAFDNVILHVVEKHDCPIYINNHELSTIEIKYNKVVFDNYENLLKNEKWIPCQDKIRNFDMFLLRMWFSSLMIERLKSKTDDINRILSLNKNNWNETFYHLLLRNFGMKINSIPFELLAKSLPLQILSKHKNNLFQLEALLFGQSGLLNESLLGDDYFLTLRDEFSFLFKKYKLKSVDSHLWKFMRSRPVNFPTIRIAQIAMLINKSSALFSKIVETGNVADLHKLFNVSASEYWNNHYRFNTIAGKNKPKSIGSQTIDSILINTVIPILFIYGENTNQHELKDRALKFLEDISPESNQIIRKWSDLGVVAGSAFETQSLLHLKNNYCSNKNCLNCRLGAKIISTI